MAYEEPAYEVVREYEAFELRDYDPYVVAETVVPGDFEDVGGKAFNRLFGYISGANRGDTEIAMTVPVTQRPAGDPAGGGMTTTEAAGGGRYAFAFVMPSRYSLQTLPEPASDAVRLRRVEGGLVAARRYSGTWSEARYRRHEEKLLAAVAAAGLKPVGAPVFARYNSPFSLWFLRRNEVLVAVARE